ncbi:MAG: hypothetical protein A4S14_01000 [Proteobacteria bacterium SG_bin9]|nr:MAG: hypothetical protein A4S14_01000 [Proteobacteria bacterium SG_bin9]
MSAPFLARLSVFVGAGLTGLIGLGPTSAAAQFTSRGDWPGLFADRAEPYPQRPIRQRQAKASYPKLPDAPKNDLKPQGPLVIMVSLEKQRLKIYDERGLFAESPISSGTKSHPTPMGVFSILEKSKWHRSNLYSSAPMPFMQRITWSGVALHAGELPGYPASHGCIRLPAQFAARLWNWTNRRGARVIITPDEVTPVDVTHKTLVAMLPSPVADLPQSKLPVRTADASGVLPAIKSDAIVSDTPLRGTTTDVKVADDSKPIAATTEPTTIEVKADDKAVASAAPVDTAEKPVETPSADVKADDAKPAEAAETKTDEAKPAEAAATSAPAPEVKTADTPVEIKGPEIKATEPAAETKAAETKPDDAAPSRTGTVTLTINDALKGSTDKPAVADAPTEPQTPAWMQLPKRSGQVAVLISKKDGKLYMRQNFEPVFEVPVTFADDKPIGTHVFTVRKASEDNTSFEWSVASLPGVVKTLVERQPGKTPSGKTRMRDVFHSTFGPTPMTASQALDRISIPEEALQRIAFNLSAGSSIVVSDVSFNTGGETGRGTEFIVPLR